MRTMIFPGSFDPPTKGHVDIARRASRFCDRLIVAVLVNQSKSSLFSPDERVHLLQLALAEVPGCQIIQSDDLLVRLFSREKAVAVVRGLRSESDFHFEAQMAAANKILLPSYEVCLLPCRSELSFISSSIVKEVASYGGEISGMVPAAIVPYIEEKIRGR